MQGKAFLRVHESGYEEHVKDPFVGAICFPFVFRFLTYSLSCIRFLFALRYFVNYAPLLRAVCKFRYSLLSRLFITSFTGLLV